MRLVQNDGNVQITCGMAVRCLPRLANSEFRYAHHMTGSYSYAKKTLALPFISCTKIGAGHLGPVLGECRCYQCPVTRCKGNSPPYARSEQFLDAVTPLKLEKILDAKELFAHWFMVYCAGGYNLFYPCEFDTCDHVQASPRTYIINN